METADFDYELPPGRIAQHPVEPRDSARLLVDLGGEVGVEHRHVRDLTELLDAGDLLVVNNTRVLRARLHLAKEGTGGAVELLLLESRRSDGRTGEWEALVRPSRRVAPGTVLVDPSGDTDVTATVGAELGDGLRLVSLDAGPDGLDVALARVGEVPLPPYITEPLADPERYQTVYADPDHADSSAAPTAGLHLTTELMGAVRAKGVEIAEVELVVGLGTFRPIEVDRVEDHHMHRERYRVPPSTWEACRSTRERGGRVVAVGTTAVRALESAAATGELEGHTEVFIHEGFEFQVVDRLLTNFHLPKSSLLVMIDAFTGPRWRDLYAVALAADYRFLSFGDAMLISRKR